MYQQNLTIFLLLFSTNLILHLKFLKDYPIIIILVFRLPSLLIVLLLSPFSSSYFSHYPWYRSQEMSRFTCVIYCENLYKLDKVVLSNQKHNKNLLWVIHAHYKNLLPIFFSLSL